MIAYAVLVYRECANCGGTGTVDQREAAGIPPLDQRRGT